MSASNLGKVGMLLSFCKFLKNQGLAFTLLTYLVLCFIFGGAASWPYVHAYLQALAAMGIAILVLTWPKSISLSTFVLPLIFVSAGAIIGIAQCIPLPITLWSTLPGRGAVLEGYASLDLQVRSLPVSLDVESTISSLGYSLTPVFVLLLCARIGSRGVRRVLPSFLCLAGFCMVALGLIQVFQGRNGLLYLYEQTNVGYPVGTFATVNHTGTFLLMIIPPTIHLLQSLLRQKPLSDGQMAAVAVVTSMLLIMLVGVVASGSMAIYVLLGPVLALAFLSIQSGAFKPSRFIVSLIGSLVMAMVAFAVVVSSPLFERLGVSSFDGGPTSRASIWSYTVDAVGAYWPIGSGAGTYQSVIPMYEDPDKVTSTYISLAHNEYLQVLVEFGALGLVVVLSALGWFLLHTWRIWSCKRASPSNKFRKAAVIGVIVCAMHSVVDFPLRTPAITSLLALYVGVVCLKNKPDLSVSSQQEKNEKRMVI